MRYSYQALDKRGATIMDVIEAATIPEAIDALRKEGLYVTDLQEATGRERVHKKVVVEKATADSGQMTVGQLLFFTRQMSMLLKAGSPVVPALASIGKQMKGPARAVVDKVRQDMEEGRGLADSLRQFSNTFSPIYTAIVGAGEMSAALPEMFERLAKLVHYRREIRNRLLSAAVYPALLIMLSISIMSTMILFILPRFQQLFLSLKAELPAATKVLFNLAATLRGHLPLVIIVAAGTLIGGVLYIRSATGRQHWANGQTRLPVLGRLFQRLIQAQWFRVMGLLLESRVGIMETLNLAANVTSNRDFRSLNQMVTEDLERGNRLAEGLSRSAMISPSIVQAILTGEESGHLDTALLFVAEVLDEENTQIINTLTKLVEPAILIVMGGLVGTMAMALFIPLFDLAASAH
ncbi:MAG: putative type II secretion system protein F [Phycisphaerae bacterium]|nr:putative type II secretion system protein F [Phycisphaerae bacterium]